MCAANTSGCATNTVSACSITSVDADTASPRACFQFSEDLPARTDFSPFVVLAGTDKPAISTAEKQLCVEGLKHGDSYTVTLRAGLPSVVHESLSKSSDFVIYVRDRKPAVRFSSTAYVLPRTGQRGIPVISVNTKSVAVEIYRISDRNLVDAIAGCDQLRPRRFPKKPRPLRHRAAQGKPRRPGLERRSRRRLRAAQYQTSPRHFRSTRRSAISNPASTSWWRSRRS